MLFVLSFYTYFNDEDKMPSKLIIGVVKCFKNYFLGNSLENSLTIKSDRLEPSLEALENL